ncbi:hypothetical protein F2Q70_00027759 [Brassica cretica]|uniref:Uncharacterized protein n=1 Tax=Brassica cretica TaxID=69181 RepID=A0A8S9L5A7_BRACR|nr:hypothetical protein F2Q70_00027759 [Brassica cretica]
MTEMVWWPETDYDELQRRRESSRQGARAPIPYTVDPPLYTTEENYGGELLVGVQWLAIVTGEKPPSLIVTSCSRRREDPEEDKLSEVCDIDRGHLGLEKH